MNGIIITGIGAVTPFGAGVDALWTALLNGDSAISDLDLFDLGGIACTRAGVIRHCPPTPGLDDAPRATRFAAVAAQEALAHIPPSDRHDIALITASNFGGMDIGERALQPEPEACARHCETRGFFV